MTSRNHVHSPSVVVTGGAGMLAHAFKSALAANGMGAEFVSRQQWDIADPPQTELMFEDLHPTLLINCAAYTKVDLAEKETDLANRVNGIAPGHLAQLCRQYGAKLVHFSTDYVFDGTLRRPLRPHDPVGPQSAYGRTKLLGEQAIQDVADLDYLIIRTAWLYGPNGPSFPQTILNVARQGKPLKVIDDQLGSPTFTFDLAEATLNLVDAGARGVFHIRNSGQTSWHDFAAAILDEFEVRSELTRTTSQEWKQSRPESATRPAYSVLDTSEYSRLTGKSLRPWREALHAYRRSLEG
jgi:dTDP-4-dehydrorhamnose reductase